ncbi:33853_t:CDS:2 [Gigaspora margarita]|uniref:33853_t:CDS:1 n=1 Tax=Gigaspora margarita TaxID=4874 RepID=A0ABM8VXG4_GIGMA|nr:33853_t:CDS:2 [Gigaspora margarita]
MHINCVWEQDGFSDNFFSDDFFDDFFPDCFSDNDCFGLNYGHHFPDGFSDNDFFGLNYGHHFSDDWPELLPLSGGQEVVGVGGGVSGKQDVVLVIVSVTVSVKVGLDAELSGCHEVINIKRHKGKT